MACDAKLCTPEFLTLLDDFAVIKNQKFKYRGYAIVRQCQRTGQILIDKVEPRLVEFEKVKPVWLSLDNHDNHTFIEEFKNELFKLDKFKKVVAELAEESGEDLQSLFARGCSKPAECEMIEVATQLALVRMLRDAQVPIEGLCGEQVNSLVMAAQANHITFGQAIQSAKNANQVTIRRTVPDNVFVLRPNGLAAIGELYTRGIDLRSSKLYAPVKFPLPSWTPTLSSLLKWNHNVSQRVDAKLN